MQTDPLHAVYDDDLRKLLENLGVLDQFDNGQMICKFCGEVITENNLSAVFPDNGEVAIVCDKLDCSLQLNMRISTKEDPLSSTQVAHGE